MSPIASETNLYNRVGGANGISRMVEQFYVRVLDDPAMRPCFEGVEVQKLQHMQFEFFSAALGGPSVYSGRTMQVAHQGRGITREHFQAFVEHLFETLKDYSLTDDDRYSIIARINTYADDVLANSSAPSE